MKEGERYQIFSRRAFVLAGVQLLALVGLGARLRHLTLVEGEKYRVRAENNRISLRLIAPERGEILDRNNIPLAVNKPDFRIFLVPEEAVDVEATLDKLSDIVALSPRRRRIVERKIARQRDFVPVSVVEHLDWQTFSRVNVAMPDLPGVVPDAGLTRFYPEPEIFSHIIGYMGRPDESRVSANPLYQLPGFQLGREGMEAQYEEALRGESGRRSVEVNAVGREIRELPDRQEALPGAPLGLTLDIRLQRKAFELLGAQAAGAVLLDVQSGEILAMASTPSYDANEFNTGISEANWQALLADPRKPLLNKSLAGQFPPGSTFKMVVALAAMEQGLITPETKFRCNGKHVVGDTTFHCWKREGHGTLDLNDAIAKSCDVYFYKLAEQMDIDDIADMASRCGLGQAFDIGLDGVKEGLLPTKQWKWAVHNQRWQKGETVNVSIGQGAILTTPLQLAVMTARLASGRVITPHLLRKQPGDQGYDQLDVNPLHLDFIRKSMVAVMRPGGTAFDPTRRKSMPLIGGKTGTAQVRRITLEERETGVLENDELPWRYRDHALFVGFSTADDPRFAVAVLVQHGGGSSVAVPLGRELLDYAINLPGLGRPRTIERLDRADEEANQPAGVRA